MESLPILVSKEITTCIGSFADIYMTTTAGAGGVHDVGGLVSASLKLDLTEQPMEHWEKCIHALLVVLACKQPPLITTDELRRAVEALEPQSYISWKYYDKWSAAIATILLERVVMVAAELDVELSADERRSNDTTQPLFATGQQVLVRSEDARLRWRRPHIRCPGYIHGQRGEIIEHVGLFKDPFLLAFRGAERKQHLYRVRFSTDALWNSTGEAASSADIVDAEEVNSYVCAEIYEDWLVCCDQASEQTKKRRKIQREQHLLQHTQHSHHSDDAHDHGHTHKSRYEVECNAVDKEGPMRPGKVIGDVLLRILQRKNIVTADQLRNAVESLEATDTKMLAADLVVRAWKDSAFKIRLLQNAQSAAGELGICTSNPNAPTILKVVENTDTVHNVIVCTLCSCYPQALLGFSPSWYKSRSYRARIVREPREVLQEFGTTLPPDVDIHVHDSTADCRYFVLPLPPKEVDVMKLSEVELRSIVTRDSMIGVKVL